MNSVNEVGHIANSMVNKTLLLLRLDPNNEKKLREIWIETGIILDEWNKEVRSLL